MSEEKKPAPAELIPIAEVIEKAKAAMAGLPPRFRCERCGDELGTPGWACERCQEILRQELLQGQISEALGSVPKRYGWAKFEARELFERVRPATEVEAAYKLPFAPMTVIVGPSGAGKTSLACAMFRRAILAQLAPARGSRVVYAPWIGRAHSESPLGSAPPRLHHARLAPLLLLDDMGAEVDRMASREASGAVTELLSERHQDERPTLVTTWLQPEQVKARYGDGLARRLFEKSQVIRLGGA